MRATDFEFRRRFWFICLVYLLGFESYGLDHANVTVGLVKWIFGGSDQHLKSAAARLAIHELFALSAFLVAAGAVIRTWGSAYLRTDVVHDSELHTERLVADGPYRYVRNPLYLGALLLAAGMAMVASRLGAAIILVGQWVVVRRLIGREEAALIESQGEPYRAFLASVPRLWPSLRPRVPAGGMKPKWVQAVLGEAWMWTFVVDGALMAWKLNEHLYVRILWVFAVIYFVTIVVLKVGKRRAASHAQPH